MYVKSHSKRVMILLILPGLVFLAYSFKKHNIISQENTAHEIYTSIKTVVHSESGLVKSTSIPSEGVLMSRPQENGLGNQLFFFAASYALSRSLRIPLLVPFTGDSSEGQSRNFSCKDFGLNHLSLPKATYIQQQQIENLTNIYNASCQMVQNVSLIPQDVLNGTKYFTMHYCFSGEIFAKFQEELKEIRVNVEEPSESYLKWLNTIGSFEWPVAIHVRRGDVKKQYWAAPIDYFKDAMRRIKKEAPRGLRLAYFVFSNEIDFARKGLVGEDLFFLELGLPAYFVSGSFGGLTNLEELDLMIKCRSIVVSGGTFSWWSAYLMKDGKNKKIVIRPKFNATRHRNEVGWKGKSKANEYLYENAYPQEWIPMEA